MSQHLAYRLYRQSVLQTDCRGKGVPCGVKSQRFLNTAKPCYLFEMYVHRVASRDGKQIPLGRFVSESPRVNAPITLNDGSSFG